MRKRSMGTVAVLSVLLLTATACGKKSTPSAGGSGSPSASTAAALTVISAGKLTVGSCLDYQPFEYYDGNELKGFDVDVIEAMAEEMGLSVEWKKANFDTIFTALAAGQFDAVAAASTITPERQQVVDFSDPYYNARQALTVNTDKTPDIATTDDLSSGDVVGVQKGTTGKAWAEENLAPKGVQIKTYTNAPDAFTDLEGGNITGVINDEPSSESEVESRPGLSVVQAIDTGEHYGFAVSKDHPDVLEAVNGALAKVISDGTYSDLYAIYFPGVPVPPEYGG